MCCLFGYYNYGSMPIKNISKLTNFLARQATIRGTDASGIAYNDNNKLIIHKESKSADLIDFKHPEDVVSVLGHTRHSTQGSCKRNYNNHPFSGHCKNLNFALAHNGVLMNDKELQKRHKLPRTKIETDSYVAVQLLEKNKILNIENIKNMAELVDGSFAFSILDSNNTLWLIKGDSPLSIIHLPKYKLYVYASTDEILYKALVDTKLFEEIKNGRFEEIDIDSGDILNILPSGEIIRDRFNYMEYIGIEKYNWWDYTIDSKSNARKSYIEELKAIATYQGISSEEIDDLLNSGFTLDEIEDYIYCME